MAKNRKIRTTIRVVILSFFFLPILVPQSLIFAEEVKEVSLDFDDVDIRLFVRVISELTGKNFIIDNNVRGKVTVLSPKKLTTRQAYEVFKSVLAVNGFAVVEAGEVTKIVPAQNMSGYGLPLSTKKIRRGEDQFITQIMPIKHLNASLLQPLVKPLLSRQGTILAPPSSDLLIITDYKNNIKKVDELLDEIDIEMVDQVVERLDLKHSSAGPISSKLTEILEAKYGKTKKGARTEFFKIVPLDRINAILTIASPDIIMEVRSILSKIDDPTPEGKSLLNVYYLENANAEDVVNILTQTQEAMVGAGEREGLEVPQRTEAGGTVVGGRFKAEGKDIAITADKSTNSLVIYAKPDDYDSIKEMIQKLDIPRQQVFIEALIMDITPTEEFLFGTEWEGLRDLGHPLSEDARQGLIGGSINSGELGGLLAGENLGNGFSLGVLGETIRVGSFTFPSLSVLIRAVESLQTADILSKPQLLTLNNETANINIAENRPFETSTTSSPDVGVTSNIEYRDVGIILQITPHINKAGKIRLEVSLEVSNFTGTAGAGDRPFTLRRTIDTFVEVNNGHTVVIGGLIQRQRDFSRGSTPCLGGVPLMGWAFKSVGIDDTRTNLMVFISPRVVEAPEDAEALSKEKMKYMEDERNRHLQKIESEKPFFMENDPKLEKKKEEEALK